MKPKIRTPYNQEEFPEYFETQTLPSMTIPDQTMSLQELLTRHQRGLPIRGNDMHPVYYGEEFMLPDMNKLDLAEKEQLRKQNADFIQQQQSDLAEQNKAKDKKAAEAAKKKIIEEHENDKKSKTPPNDDSKK